MTEEVLPQPVAAAASATEPTVVSRNPFSVAGYRIWWAASVVAGTGVGIQAVTVPLFIRDRVSEDQRAAAIAAALICQTLPGAALALFGGVIADRVERRRILVRTYAVAAAVSLIYVALAGFEASVIWPVFILAAIVGSAGAFTNPARQSMMPQILHVSQIQNGAIWGTMAFMATLQFGGPSIGGLLADGWGLTVAFAAEVAMLALAAVFFGRIATDMPVPTGRSVRHDLAEGIRYVRKDSSLLGILALGTVPGVFLMGPFAVTVVLMVEDVYEASDKYVGFLWGSLGAGIVFGSWLPLSMALAFIAGIVGPAIFINFAVALLQENTDRQMMGRVMSMYGLSFSASIPIGYAQAGIQASLWGPQATLVSSAAIAASVGLLAILFLRPVNRLP